MPGSTGRQPKCLFKNRPTLQIVLPEAAAIKAANLAKSTGDRLNVVLSKALCAELGIHYVPSVVRLSAEELKERIRVQKRLQARRLRAEGKLTYKPSKETRAKSLAKKRNKHIAELEAAGKVFVPRGETLVNFPIEWHKLPKAARSKKVYNLQSCISSKRCRDRKKLKEANDYLEAHLSHVGNRLDNDEEYVRNKKALEYIAFVKKHNEEERLKNHRFRVVVAKTPSDLSVKWPSCSSCAYFATTRNCICLFENGGVHTQGDMVCEKYVTFDHDMEFPPDWKEFVEEGIEEKFEKDETLVSIRKKEREAKNGKTGFIGKQVTVDVRKNPKLKRCKFKRYKKRDKEEFVMTQEDIEAVARMNEFAKRFNDGEFKEELSWEAGPAG